MPRKYDPTTLEHHIIRRALCALGAFEIYFSEFAATWIDPTTLKQVDVIGEIDSEISLRTAQIHGSNEVHDLRRIFTESEMRAFNFAINSARMRSAA